MKKLIKDLEVNAKLVKMQQDFTKERIYQTKPISFSDKSFFLNNENTVDQIYLDFNKTFERMP